MLSSTLLNKGRLERFVQVNKGEKERRKTAKSSLEILFSFNNFTAGLASISKSLEGLLGNCSHFCCVLALVLPIQ